MRSLSSTLNFEGKVMVVMMSLHDESGGQRVVVGSIEQNVLKELASQLDFLVVGKLMKGA